MNRIRYDNRTLINVANERHLGEYGYECRVFVANYYVTPQKVVSSALPLEFKRENICE